MNNPPAKMAIASPAGMTLVQSILSILESHQSLRPRPCRYLHRPSLSLKLRGLRERDVASLVEVHLHFVGEATGHLADNLVQEAIAGALDERFG